MTFGRSATSTAIRRFLYRLRKTGHPLVLTINGNAELVVQDAEAYQALLDRVAAIEGSNGAWPCEGRPHETCAPGICSATPEALAYRVELARNAEAELEELYLWDLAPGASTRRQMVQRSRTGRSFPRSTPEVLSDRA